MRIGREPMDRSLSRGLVYMVGIFAATSLIACGSDDDSTDSEPSAGSTDLSEVQATVDELLGPVGTYQKPPAEAPTPEPGKNIWLISCGQSLSACNVPIGGAERAAQAMGWETHIFDTKADYTQATTGLQQAIADDADGIFLYYIDCRYIKSGLQQAKDAGIPVVAAESQDCSEANPGAPSLFSYVTTYSGGVEVYDQPQDLVRYIEDYGRAQAYYTIVDTDGQANGLGYSDNSTVGGPATLHGYEDAYAECADCEWESIYFPIGELYKGIRERVSQDLLKNPDVNVLGASYDAVAQAGMAEAAAASGRDIIVMGGEGAEGGMELLRAGKMTGGSGIPLGWEAYAAIDNLNRIFNDEETVGSGIGIQLYDQDHNVPASGPYVAPYDYEALYQEAWAAGD